MVHQESFTYLNQVDKILLNELQSICVEYYCIYKKNKNRFETQLNIMSTSTSKNNDIVDDDNNNIENDVVDRGNLDNDNGATNNNGRDNDQSVIQNDQSVIEENQHDDLNNVINNNDDDDVVKEGNEDDDDDDDNDCRKVTNYAELLTNLLMKGKMRISILFLNLLNKILLLHNK